MGFKIYLLLPYLGLLISAKHFENADQTFKNFMKKYDKTYKNPGEESYRRGVYKLNLNAIRYHNQRYESGQHSYNLRINQFADMTLSEFTHFMGFGPFIKNNNDKIKKFNCNNTFTNQPNTNTIPKSFDWRDHNAVTSIKNQEQCGCCWSFSAGGAIEGAWAIKYGKLKSVSTQQMLDCSSQEYVHDHYYNEGCNGGFQQNALLYVMNSGGIMSYDKYKYKAKEESCKYKAKDAIAQVKSCTESKAGNENIMQNALYLNGHMAIAVDASGIGFQFYSEGIYYNPKCNSNNLDHAMTLVGYGSDSSGDYWIVKNQWGKSWGDNGYIKMARNRNNNCGISSSAAFVSV